MYGGGCAVLVRRVWFGWLDIADAFYFVLFLVIELAGVATLSVNILQSSYALKYPPPPPSPTLPSNSKSKSKALSTPTTNPPKRKLGALISPSTSPSPQPQPQRSFSFSSPPLSTPSRTLNYTLPSASLSSQSPSFTLDSSLNSSFGSSGGTGVGAASPLAAYRGKHADRVGRALDGSFLAGLASGDESD